MKRFLCLALMIGVILSPFVCGASYLIEFKSGSQFITSHYWTTGSQVHFYSHGGVMVIPKNMIKRISNSDRTPQIEIETQPEEQPEKIIPKPKAEQDIDVEALKKKKTELEENMKFAERKLKQADKSGNKTGYQAAVQEFLKHRDALVQYYKEILKQNNNESPEWW